jgi:Flp pilus assembly protein TadG
MRGQATVELVFMLPLVLVLLLAVVQVAVVARAHVLVGAAARDAARAAAVGGAESARDAALDGSGLDPARTDVQVVIDGEMITAHVTYRDGTSVPLVGRLAGDVTVQASVTMRRER